MTPSLYTSFIADALAKVIDNVVPEVGTFFDSILRCDYEEVPSATEVLKSFRDFRTQLTEEQLSQPPGGIFWKGEHKFAIYAI